MIVLGLIASYVCISTPALPAYAVHLLLKVANKAKFSQIAEATIQDINVSKTDTELNWMCETSIHPNYLASVSSGVFEDIWAWRARLDWLYSQSFWSKVVAVPGLNNTGWFVGFVLLFGRRGLRLHLVLVFGGFAGDSRLGGVTDIMRLASLARLATLHLHGNLLREFYSVNLILLRDTLFL